MAQSTAKMAPLSESARMLKEDSIQALKSGRTDNINNALMHLNLSDQQLASGIDGGMTSNQLVKISKNLTYPQQELRPHTNLTILPRVNENKTVVNGTIIPKNIANLKTYENLTLGIKIQYPSHWEKSDESRSTVTFSSPLKGYSDFYRENVNVVVLYSRNMSLDATVNTLINYDKRSYNNFTLLNDSNVKNSIINTTLDGYPARKIVYTYNNLLHRLELKGMDVIAIKGNKAYVFSYSAEPSSYDYYLSMIQKMIGSLQLELSPYENPTLGISIQYPHSWNINERFGSVIGGITAIKFTSPYENGADPFREYLSIETFNFTNMQLNKIPTGEESKPHFKIIQSANTTLSGSTAYIKI